MEEESKITVSEGKYTFITYKDDYRVHCLRYGEPWMIFTEGHKALSALISETLYILKNK